MFYNTAFCGQWGGWDPVNRLNRIHWMTEVTSTDRTESVHNHCVIKVFGGVFELSLDFDFLML